MADLSSPWDAEAPGVMALPSGLLVRGRPLRDGVPAGPEPTFGVYLLGQAPPATDWESRWVRWPDFRLPRDPDEAAAVLRETHGRLAGDRVEVACGGGRGRTGTALACLVVLDDPTEDDPVGYVRRHHHRHAVETPGQRRYVAAFGRTHRPG